MKAISFLIILSFLAFSCSGEEKSTKTGEKSSEVIDSTETQEVPKITNNLPDPKTGFWIINLSATETEQQAIASVIKLRETDPLFGYLWIPDYATLSGKELFAVFKGPYLDMKECIVTLVEYQKIDPKAYAVRVEQEGKLRKSVYGIYDIRNNKIKQNLVLTYATPEDEENYEGEDWGWFVNDISTHMVENYSDIYFDSVFRSWLQENDIKKLQKELQPEGFGYVCIKKTGEKIFIPHDMPSVIIPEMTEFFGYKKVEE